VPSVGMTAGIECYTHFLETALDLARGRDINVTKSAYERWKSKQSPSSSGGAGKSTIRYVDLSVGFLLF